mmetsp:Transcript_26910/g.89588  ORF Transcript_26910/g.89588 Transcript_26910/m.89588 type:complete len:203 (-) Transcript_26910:366-974(-)
MRFIFMGLGDTSTFTLHYEYHTQTDSQTCSQRWIEGPSMRASAEHAGAAGARERMHTVRAANAPQGQSQPPSTSIVVPVTKSFSMAKMIPLATSSGWPGLAIALAAVISFSREFVVPSADPNIGVAMMPGLTTLMRRGATSRAMERAICSTAAPTLASATWPGFGLRAGAPLTSTTQPVALRCGTAHWTTFAYPHSLSKDPL